jgi:hypothetical protein
VDHVTKVEWLAILVGDVSKILADLGMPPIPGIPWDPCIAGDILEMVDIILECLREAYASGHGPRIRCRSLVTIISIIRPALAFCFVFILFLDVKYYKDSVSFMFLHDQACHRHP